MSVKEVKEFLWFENKPVNYELKTAPNSQNLPEFFTPTFGIVIVKKESMLEDFGIDSYYIVFSSYEKAYDHAHLTVYGKSFAFANIQKQAAKFLKDQEEAADLGDNMHLAQLSAQEEKDRASMRDSTPAYRQINKQ